ncbi:hypothetical protein B0H19DRAFT_1256111 [Mycena capillaripes]|nr:hypothetical protein B0H19DRAFT_1256111 [Mycena capillaripes]
MTATNLVAAAHHDPSKAFTLSGPSSVASSRTSSPTLFREENLFTLDHPGSRPMDVYDATLPPWCAAVRRALVAQIRVESVLVASVFSLAGLLRRSMGSELFPLVLYFLLSRKFCSVQAPATRFLRRGCAETAADAPSSKMCGGAGEPMSVTELPESVRLEFESVYADRLGDVGSRGGGGSIPMVRRGTRLRVWLARRGHGQRDKIERRSWG